MLLKVSKFHLFIEFLFQKVPLLIPKPMNFFFQVDNDRNRVSLGMKNSYFKDDEPLQTSSDQNPDYDEGKVQSVALAEPKISPRNTSTYDENNKNESESQPDVLDYAKSRALVPALEVVLDDIESVDDEGDVSQVVQTVNADTIEGKTQKKAKRKAREEK